ncbi:unnamed protein product [Bursaphelenchus xylophilus]|nr:unnamed protein product [Bursaphelenchus xylophilus]CAG9106200.1 unnamed protein product [Bursaphelenchus xylophilus]
MMLTWGIIFFASIYRTRANADADDCAIKLTIGQSREVASNGRTQTKVYKFVVDHPSYLFPFADAKLKLDKVPSDLHVNLWPNCEAYEHDEAEFSITNILDWMLRTRKGDTIPAMNGIVGVSTSRSYTISVDYDPVNIYRFAAYIVACTLFLLSKEICHRTVSVYTSSAFIGVFASIILLALFLRRFLPRSILFVPLEWMLWPAISYAYYFGYYNLYELAYTHWKFLGIYTVVAAVASVIVCYVSGVSNNVRLKNVFQWTLQAIAVGMVLMASQSAVFSVGTILVLVTTFNGLHRFFGKPSRLMRYIWKPKPVHKMLTEEEYREQAEETTRAELEKLRQYLADNCRQLNSRTTPLRKCRNTDAIGSFLVTGSDVSLASLHEHSRLYENEDYSDDITDDSDDEEDLPAPGQKDSTKFSADFTDDSDASNSIGWRREHLNISKGSPKRFR